MRTSKGPRKGRKLPDVLTEEEQKALLRQPNLRYPTGLRNQAMMKLMLDVGLRTSELLNLKTRDIDWMSGKVFVHEGKGKKDRVLWLNEDALEILRKWKEKRPVQTELLFTTLKGTPIRSNYLREMVKRYGRKAGLSKGVHPHLLRHSFATDLLRDSKNLRLVQKALGHADISTTSIYLHVVDEELEAAMRGFRKKA